MSRPCTLIVNPTSGSYREDALHRAVAGLESRGLSPEVLFTGSAADAPRFAEQLCAERESPLIVACGGDGTINGVLNGITSPAATLAILPFGTASVLALELGISGIDDAVERIAREKTRPLAVGVAERRGERRRFFLDAGIGFDGAVVAGVRLGEKRLFGKGAYFLSFLRAVWRWDERLLRVTVDDAPYPCHSVVVCNAPRYGGDHVLAPGADLFTPGFRVVLFESPRRLPFLASAARLFVGGVSAEGALALPARRVEVAGGKAVQLDGDPWGEAPLSISAEEGVVRLIV